MAEKQEKRWAEMNRQERIAHVQKRLEQLKLGQSEGVYELPQYKEYVVDFKLREFRKLRYGELPEFVPFASPKGRALMQGFKQSLQQGR